MRRLVPLALGLVLLAPVPGRAQTAREARAELPEPTVTAFWTALGDTALERLIARALHANRDLHAAEARVHAARASRTGAAYDLAPAVTASAGYNRQRLSSATFPGAAGRLPEQELWDAGLHLSWELDVFGRLRRSLQGRNALLASAEADVHDVQVILAAEVAAAYFDLQGAEERLAVAQRNAENQRRSLEITRDRLDAGRGSALDTERAQAQLSSTLAAIPELESQATAIRHRIAVLLGEPPATAAGLTVAAVTPRLPAGLEHAATREAVRARPDVRSAEHRLAARRAFAGAARAEYLPRLSLGGVAGYTASQLDALGNSGTPRYTIGPVISWPLLDLGRVKSGVDVARAEESQAAAEYEQAILRAQQEMETSLAGYARARERLQHLADAAAASERATDLARLRFEEGGTDFLEVLDAERRQLEAQDRLAAGRTEASRWLVAAYRAAGGRLTE